MTTTTAIVPAQQTAVDRFMPLMDVSRALVRYQATKDFIAGVLKSGTDFGVIPGTGDNAKPTLLKPGAEKLASFFGLSTAFETVKEIEDWDGAEHNGEPLFYYRLRCTLTRDGSLVASAEGSCNSRETKYRYRDGKRKCPKCGATTIFKSKKDDGWYCWEKRGGCGAQFRGGDPAIEGQKTGREPNADIADQANTILKMAQKRALIAAVLNATNASDVFTQDAEDFIDGEYTVAPTQAHPEAQARQPERAATKAQRPTNTVQGAAAAPQTDPRPWSAVTVKHNVEKFIESLLTAAAGNGAVAANGDLKSAMAALSGLVNGRDFDRKAILRYLFGVDSGAQLSIGQCKALKRWIGAKPNADGEWIPEPHAASEAASIIAADAIARGQQTLPLTPTGDAVLDTFA